MRFLDILVVLRLDLSQISFNLVENTFVARQLALLPTRIAFYDIFARACAEIKILSFWMRRWPTSLGFFIFEFFSLSFLLQWLTFYLACLRLKNFQQSVIEAANFYHGAARCSGRKFCSEFFTHLFENFCAFLAPLDRSLWSGHHWKDLFLLQKLSIDDGNFGQKWWRQKWKKRGGSSQPVTSGTRVK